MTTDINRRDYRRIGTDTVGRYIVTVYDDAYRETLSYRYDSREECDYFARVARENYPDVGAVVVTDNSSQVERDIDCVIDFVRENRTAQLQEVVECCGLNPHHAHRLVATLLCDGRLVLSTG